MGRDWRCRFIGCYFDGAMSQALHFVFFRTLEGVRDWDWTGNRSTGDMGWKSGAEIGDMTFGNDIDIQWFCYARFKHTVGFGASAT
jgi:hypothetical protein